MNTPAAFVDEPTVPIPRALIDALDHSGTTDPSELPLSVWVPAQTSAAAQRKGLYVPDTTAHPAKMLPAVAAHAIRHYTRPGELVFDPMAGAGTTLVEALDAARRVVGVEYEPHWVAVTPSREPESSGIKTGVVRIAWIVNGSIGGKATEPRY